MARYKNQPLGVVRPLITLLGSGPQEEDGVSENYAIDEIASYVSAFIEAGGVTPIDHNNLIPTLIPNGSSAGFESVAEAVNASTSFEVTELQILHIINSYQTPGLQVSGSINIKTDYHFLAIGKGSYGIGGTELTDADFVLIRSSTNAVIPAPTTPGNTLGIYTINTANFTTPIDDLVDSENQVITVDANEDVYILVNEIGLVAQGGFLGRKIYRFIGATGTYGLASGNATEPGDYLLLEEFNSGTQISSSDPLNLGIFSSESSLPSPSFVLAQGSFAKIVNAVFEPYTAYYDGSNWRFEERYVIIEGNRFRYIPLPSNNTETIVAGDVASDGWISQTEFGKKLTYRTGPAVAIASWDIEEKI